MDELQCEQVTFGEVVELPLDLLTSTGTCRLRRMQSSKCTVAVNPQEVLYHTWKHVCECLSSSLLSSGLCTTTSTTTVTTTVCLIESNTFKVCQSCRPVPCLLWFLTPSTFTVSFSGQRMSNETGQSGLVTPSLTLYAAICCKLIYLQLSSTLEMAVVHRWGSRRRRFSRRRKACDTFRVCDHLSQLSLSEHYCSCRLCKVLVSLLLQQQSSAILVGMLLLMRLYLTLATQFRHNRP